MKFALAVYFGREGISRSTNQLLRKVHVSRQQTNAIFRFKVHIKVGIAKFQPETRGLGS